MIRTVISQVSAPTVTIVNSGLMAVLTFAQTIYSQSGTLTINADSTGTGTYVAGLGTNTLYYALTGCNPSGDPVLSGTTVTWTVAANAFNGSSAAVTGGAVTNGSGIGNPANIANLALWYSGRTTQCYTDSPPTTLCTTGQNVRVQKALGTGLSNAGQSTAGDQPTTETDGLKLNTTSAYLQLDTPLALTGDFTAYFSGNLVSSVNWTPFGSTTTGATMTLFGGSTLFFVTDAGANATRSISPTGATLIRIRRASDTVFISCTGVVENAGTARSGTCTVNTVGARPFTPQWNGSVNNRYLSAIVYSSSLTPDDADDLAVRSYLQAQDGVSL